MQTFCCNYIFNYALFIVAMTKWDDFELAKLIYLSLKGADSKKCFKYFPKCTPFAVI